MLFVCFSFARLKRSLSSYRQTISYCELTIVSKETRAQLAHVPSSTRWCVLRHSILSTHTNHANHTPKTVLYTTPWLTIRGAPVTLKYRATETVTVVAWCFGLVAAATFSI